MMFSDLQRIDFIKNFKQEVYDIVIVGGGINGAGIARDAASRGLRVALLEAGDFAIGTSSRSSKLIHGGIRYLENLEFKLVFEALSERAILFEIAPNLVHPLRFVIPIFTDSRVSYFKMGLGMWLYDLLAAFETPQLHEGMSAQETLAEFPGMSPQKLVGAFAYSDAYMDDDRLVIETLRSAINYGAEAANFCRVTGACWQGEALQALKFKDELAGTTGEIRGRHFISAVGPWTDIFGRQICQDWRDKLRPTKGIHITFSRQRLPIDKAIVMAIEKRIIFVIPRHEMVIVGTTDTDFSDDPSEVMVTSAEIDYLMAALNKYFPNFYLQREDIIASYAGVRPLVQDGADSEGKTSREHEFFKVGENLLAVAGGKYTTYRKIAEEAVDAILKNLSFEERTAIKPSRSLEPLNPKATVPKMERLQLFVAELAVEFALPAAYVRLGIERHGEEAIELFKICKDLDVDEPKQRYWMAEATFAIHHTCCLRLEDFYWRRSPLFLSEPDNGLSLLENIATCFQYHYAWSEAQRAKELDFLKEKINQQLAWKITCAKPSVL